MRLMEDPWEIRPGGYCERVNLATGKTKTLYGKTMPQWLRDLKAQKRSLALSRLSTRKMMQRVAAQGE
jgi:hypothetical protein